MYQKPPYANYNLPLTSIYGHKLNTVEQFPYLGSVISSDATMDKNIDNCLVKANSSSHLQKHVLKNYSLQMATKVQV